MHSKRAALGGHGGEELAELAREIWGLAFVQTNHLPEEMVGQEADAIGKEAEEQPHEEVGRTLRINSSGHQVGSELGELRRYLLGYAGAGSLWSEQGRFGEDGP